MKAKKKYPIGRLQLDLTEKGEAVRTLENVKSVLMVVEESTGKGAAINLCIHGDLTEDRLNDYVIAIRSLHIALLNMLVPKEKEEVKEDDGLN